MSDSESVQMKKRGWGKDWIKGNESKDDIRKPSTYQLKFVDWDFSLNKPDFSDISVLGPIT